MKTVIKLVLCLLTTATVAACERPGPLPEQDACHVDADYRIECGPKTPEIDDLAD